MYRHSRTSIAIYILVKIVFLSLLLLGAGNFQHAKNVSFKHDKKGSGEPLYEVFVRQESNK